MTPRLGRISSPFKSPVMRASTWSKRKVRAPEPVRSDGENADLIDDETIEQFGRDLDGLGETEVATRALEEDEAADVTASAAPSVPF